ncbi:hypothetical protein [Pontiella agarivorans]|uniref:Uncharacterized protein n=1 Tax=Pontiella agarivorans TaxID=3038953 RepID=A0ABU5MSE3_9BACT|nr:hypothetical protein [Pontiella agarivorans]MDZ8117001.1 hypothetical protein [Pontiella agarivorans]
MNKNVCILLIPGSAELSAASETLKGFLRQWKAEAVSFNDDERFGSLFDRVVSRKEKAMLQQVPIAGKRP